MKISQLRVNNIEHPLGFQVEPLSFSWKVEEAGDAKKMQYARIQIFHGKERSMTAEKMQKHVAQIIR